MGNRLKVLLLIVGLLTISFGVIDSQATRHRHRVGMKYFFTTGTLTPANDPQTQGVDSLFVDCPRGYRPTGGGYRTRTIALVPEARLSRAGYGFIAINQTNESETMRVDIACVKARTSFTRASAGPSLEAEVKRLRELRRRSLPLDRGTPQPSRRETMRAGRQAATSRNPFFGNARRTQMAVAVELRELREQIVREHMDSENRHEYDATLDTFHHPRYELIGTGDVYDGEAEVRAYFDETRAAFPDQRNEPLALHHADDAVIVEFILRGTHEGSFRGLPATGRSFECRMTAFFVFEEERLVCERVYFDVGTILRQLGVAHDPSSAAGRITTIVSHPLTIGGALARQVLRR